jgi:hypothetical protein
MNKPFVISSSFQATKAFMFAEEPSVAVVLCSPALEGGFYTQWWVTTNDWKTSIPTLVTYLELGVNERAEDLEATLGVLWGNTVEQLSLGSAMTGGISMTSHQLRQLTEKQENWVITHTLLGHDHLKHFSINSNSVIERTANMYHLLRSMGVSAIQRAIAEFESLNFADNWAKFKRDEVFEMTVKTSLINQRLVLARKSGILSDPPVHQPGSVASAKAGRKPAQKSIRRTRFTHQSENKEGTNGQIKNKEKNNEIKGRN